MADTLLAPPESLPDVLRRFLSLAALLCLALSAAAPPAAAQDELQPEVGFIGEF